MAETSGKRIKKEDTDGTEVINSLNEEAAEQKAMEEALKAGQNRPPNGEEPKPDDVSANKSGPTGAHPSIEGDMNGAEFNDDSEPILLQADTGTGDLFPGVPCTTVARRCTKGDGDPSPLYLNRYGPRAKGWFVWSDTPALPEGQKVTDLQNVSEKFHRVLDYPRKQGKARYQASNVHGILNIVWNCEGLQDNPEEAAELLNPKKVKRFDVLTTSKARRDWLKEKKENALDKYPITHIDVKFHQKINDATESPVAKSNGDLLTSWEVASQYKALYRKDQIQAELRIYEAAKEQAKRFTDWYARALPQGFSEYRRSLSREPTVQSLGRPEDSVSPAPESGPTTRTELKNGLPTPEPESAPQGKSGGSPVSSSEPAGGKPESDANDERLSIDDLREAVLEGWCAAKQIKQPKSMSAKDQLKFNVYFKVYSQEMGY